MKKTLPDNNGTVQVSATANVAIFATYKSNEQAIEDVCFYIENNLSDIIQLPELFFIADKSITHDAAQLAQIALLCEQLIVQISKELRPYQYVCTSLVLNGIHQGVIINEHGIFAAQLPLNFCERYAWSALGESLTMIELPLEQGSINVAMLTADDANNSELVKSAASKDIHVLLVPFDIQAPDDVENTLLSCAQAHRICIVAATREKSFASDLTSNHANSNNANQNNQSNTHTVKTNTAKIKSKKSTGFIANLSPCSPLLSTKSPQNKNEDDKFNQLLIKHQYGKITKAVIHPIQASTKR